MVKLIDLYDTRLTNQFLKLMHEIERLQALRKGENGTAAPRKEAESNNGAPEVENGENPPAKGEDPAPAPADTQTSSPPSQPPSFVPTEGVAQPPEQAARPASDKSQDGAGQEADVQVAI
jgi:hypothetical protein